MSLQVALALHFTYRKYVIKPKERKTSPLGPSVYTGAG